MKKLIGSLLVSLAALLCIAGCEWEAVLAEARDVVCVSSESDPSTWDCLQSCADDLF